MNPQHVSQQLSHAPAMTAMHNDSQASPQVWLTDSGATNHMTPDLSNLQLSRPYPTEDTVQTADGAGLCVTNVGNSIISTSSKPLRLQSVLHVPKLTQNLLSVHRICLDNNCYLIFDAFRFWIQDKATGRVLYRGTCSNGLYPINFSPRVDMSKFKFQPQAFLGQLVLSSTWHHRLGHPTNKIVHTMLTNANIAYSTDSPAVVCTSCLQGKFCKLPFHSSVHKSVKPFHIIHSDVWGPSPCVSVDGYKYYVIFVDEFTRYCWWIPLVNKSDVYSVFVNFCASIHTQFSSSVQILQSDGGGEYVSKQFQKFLAEKGISHQKSCPYTPEQNGMAERKHRHLIETAITLLQHAKMPSSFWTYAVHTATYLINRMPSAILHHKSPYELLFGVSPTISHLRVFGCACYPLLRPYLVHKLQPKTQLCVFLGYASQYKGYICYDVSKKRSYISRHVVFHEAVFPYSELIKQASSSSNVCHQSSVCPLPTVTNKNVVTPPVSSVPSPSKSVTAPIPVSSLPILPHLTNIASSPHSITASSSCSSIPVAPELSNEGMQTEPLPSAVPFNPDGLSVVLHIPSMNLHPMQTRSKTGTIKPRACLTTISSSSSVAAPEFSEPVSYKSALKIPVWYAAMKEEIDALHNQQTWSLVSLPLQKNLVGCKWIFRIKKNADGSIARHKARLVAQGFSQEPGQDYGETFSPVVKPTTVRLVLALAAQYGWDLRQLDVKNAFLHGTLNEEVYMAQPPGFADPLHPQSVCRLHKSLYGLKQAPRAWNERFTSFLPSLGFAHTYADSSLFVKNITGGVVILLVYVDDIIITGSNSGEIHAIIHSLAAEFEITDLGSLHFFLGIQISRCHDTLFLSQSKYIHELLLKTKMLDAKPCTTPCLPYQRLSKDDGAPFDNPTLYRSLVGALQYLTFTRPDIAFSVHQVCQFMQTPMLAHFTAVKRILRYLKGTINFGLSYHRGSLDLKAFSDADWAGDPNDRRSTTGLVVFIGSNPISWSSKKQHTVSRSSTEAEYRALSSTSAEIDWIKQLLVFLCVPIDQPPVLFCDNLSAIALSFNPIQHQKTKHIEIDVHFVRERVANNQLHVQFVSSSEQFADILTKGLSTSLFHTHCNNLMLGLSKQEIEGGC